ncbi:MAG: response regulator transcription factor [Proteobacteria bacterium]|nr:response regulator transcription factor [Pseudomonadota bacterium]
MNEKQPRVAVLDDDADLCKLLRFLLEKEYEVVMADSGAHLRHLVDEGAVDVIVLDIGLPDDDGISIAQKIRTTSSIPLVFLSGYSSEEMIVKGLNIGGDDYVTKPLQPEVLLARVRNALRRAEQQPTQPMANITFGDVTFEVRDQRLTNADGRSVKLTEMEALILSALAHAENQTLSREEMFRRIYGRDWDLLNRGLEVHLSHLRRKMTEVSGLENLIVGLRGVGYRLNVVPVKAQDPV